MSMKSALLVIDAQKVYTNKKSELFCKDSTRTIERINSLIVPRLLDDPASRVAVACGSKYRHCQVDEKRA